MLLNMDTLNSTPPTSTTPSAGGPDMKFLAKNGHFLVAIIAIVAVGVGVMWYFIKSEMNYAPTQVRDIPQQADNSVEEVNSVDIGDLDAEFKGIDGDLNSL